MTDTTNAPNGAGDTVQTQNNDTQARDANAVLKKNQELLGEMSKLKEKLAGFEEAQRKAEEDTARKAGDFAKLEDNLKTENQKLKDAEKAANTKYTDLLKELSLTKALEEHKIAHAYLDGARALFMTKGIEIDAEGNAKIGTLSVSDFVKDWAASDAGKAYVSAPDSSGGGAAGSNAAGQKTIKRNEFDNLTQFDRAKFAREGGKVID